MSSKKQPKTQGYIWLEYSFVAFNGSGYGDRTTPEDFVESYIRYNQWKKRDKAVKLANEYYTPLLVLAESLISNGKEITHTPSKRQWEKYMRFQVEQNRQTKEPFLFV